MSRIYLGTDNNSGYRQPLSAIAHRLTDKPDEAEIWLADPDRAGTLLRQGHNPRWLACTYAGVDKLMAPDLPRDLILTNVRGVFGPLMAQYVFGHLLSSLRQLPRYAQQQAKGQWQPHPYGSLVGQRLCLLGTGDIAGHIARVGKAFGMAIIGVNRDGRPVANFDEVYPVEALSDALSGADVLVSVLPNTPQSHHLLNAGTLSALPRHATVINVGRGQTLCLDALQHWLGANPDASAVLDVFEQEPLPPEHPLWQHPRVILTPHVAATSFPEQVASQFLANLARFDAGEPLAHLVDYDKGY